MAFSTHRSSDGSSFACHFSRSSAFDKYCEKKSREQQEENIRVCDQSYLNPGDVVFKQDVRVLHMREPSREEVLAHVLVEISGVRHER